MKFLSNKLGLYLSVLALGGGLGYFGSRQAKPPATVEPARAYPTAIPSTTSSNSGDREVNFIATAVQRVGTGGGEN